MECRASTSYCYWKQTEDPVNMTLAVMRHCFKRQENTLSIIVSPSDSVSSPYAPLVPI